MTFPTTKSKTSRQPVLCYGAEEALRIWFSLLFMDQKALAVCRIFLIGRSESLGLKHVHFADHIFLCDNEGLVAAATLESKTAAARFPLSGELREIVAKKLFGVARTLRKNHCPSQQLADSILPQRVTTCKFLCERKALASQAQAGRKSSGCVRDASGKAHCSFAEPFRRTTFAQFRISTRLGV